MRYIVGLAVFIGILFGFGCERIPMAPEFEPVPEQYVEENDTLRVIVHALDDDSYEVTFYDISLPDGATFDPEAQLLFWVPTLDQGDSLYVAVIAATDGEHISEITINIVVLDTPTYPELMTRGWQYFSSEEYVSAVATFQRAIDLNSTADALTALGWAFLLADSLERAEELFTQALALDPALNDARAGRAAARRSLLDYPNAINDSQEVFDSSADYVFSQKSSYDYRDLLIIIAQSAYALAEYSTAQEAINILDPSNNLSPEESATWVVVNIHYNTYQEALLMTIERLEGMYGG